MTQEHERLLRAMLEARKTADAASEEARRAWQAYLDAQTVFTGRFASTDYPLGPFVVGTVLIEHEEIAETWPPKRNVFNYRDVIRCPTSD
jgi:hypothetical protein